MVTSLIRCPAASDSAGCRAAAAASSAPAVWDAATGERLLEVRHADGVHSVAFSPDGTRLATGSRDRTAAVWDAATGERVLEARHSDDAVGGRNVDLARSMVGARNVDLAQSMVSTYGLHLRSVAFSPDGTGLATGGTNKSVVIWDVSASSGPDRSS